MDKRNYWEIAVRKYEVENLTPEQRKSLALDLALVEDKLGQILEKYGIVY